MTLSSRRTLFIAASVVLFHAAALWALQAGLVRRAIEAVVPVTLLIELVTPPAPQPESPPQAKAAEPVKREPVKTAPAPLPVAHPDSPPSPNAVTGALDPQPVAPPIAAPAAAVAAPPAPPKVEWPSSDAEYLHNPKPVYPATSRRLGEQGKVVLRVVVGADGTLQDAALAQSSGYDRLDQAALDAVRRWRFVPGKRNGVAAAMAYQVPLNFTLE